MIQFWALGLDKNAQKVYTRGTGRSVMPKIKTKKIAKKKFSINKKGTIKRAGAHHSHNTAKKSPKRRRNLGQMKLVDDTNASAIKRQLPYA